MTVEAVRANSERLEIELYSDTAPTWDGFVREDSDGTFCHLAGWHSVMREALGARPHYLEARDDKGALAGVLPLVRVKSALLGDYLVSMPFLNYGGALGAEAVRTELANESVRLGVELGSGTVELRSRQCRNAQD